MRKLLIARAPVVCGVTLIAASLALAGDNLVGTWKLNAAKSNFSPGPGPKSQTLTFEATPEGIKLTVEGVSAAGQAFHGGYTSKFDGKEVPMAGDNPNADTVIPKRIDDNTFETIWKKAGKITLTVRGSVSTDGKTLTATQTGTDVQGRAANSTVVYEKQ